MRFAEGSGAIWKRIPSLNHEEVMVLSKQDVIEIEGTCLLYTSHRLGVRVNLLPADFDVRLFLCGDSV